MNPVPHSAAHEPGMLCSAGVQRALIAIVQVFGLATWFSASAVVPALEVE